MEETASGPASWARVSPTATTAPVRPEPKTTVTDIQQGEESISFDVDRIGTPVLVKTSYFPNWHVQGAKGVYWATPNLMVVIPTSLHVKLTYGYTPVDWVGLAMSITGIAGAVVLWRRRRVSQARFGTVASAGGGHFGGAQRRDPFLLDDELVTASPGGADQEADPFVVGPREADPLVADGDGGGRALLADPLAGRGEDGP